MQVPQAMVPPQPLAHTPQLIPDGHAVRGVQPVEHVPSMHAEVAAHVPQFRIPPHPSGHSPHVSPAGHAVRGVHALHWPLMQVAPPSQAPH